MTALCQMATVDELRIQIKATRAISLNLSSDLMEIELFTSSGGLLGKIRDLVFGQWNEGLLPTSPGVHEDLVFVQNPVQLWHAGQMVDADVLASLTVGVLRYAGVVDGPEADLSDLENGWRKLAPDESFDAEITFDGIQSY